MSRPLISDAADLIVFLSNEYDDFQRREFREPDFLVMSRTNFAIMKIAIDAAVGPYVDTTPRPGPMRFRGALIVEAPADLDRAFFACAMPDPSRTAPPTKEGEER